MAHIGRPSGQISISYQQQQIMIKLYYWNCQIKDLKCFYKHPISLYTSLRELIKKSYIEKVNSNYKLTDKGKNYLEENRIVTKT
jgi:predicted transcriptional regulator